MMERLIDREYGNIKLRTTGVISENSHLDVVLPYVEYVEYGVSDATTRGNVILRRITVPT